MSTEAGGDAFARRLAEALDREAERPGSGLSADADADPATGAVLAQLRAASTWSGPPPDLRERLLATVTAERAAHESSPADSSPAPTPVTPLLARHRRWLWAIPVAAVAAVAFTLAVLAVNDFVNRPARGTTYTVAGTALAPGAGAEVSVAAAPAGFSVVIDAHDLPAAAAGSYYAAFLSGPRGVVPLGSFHARQSGKPITLWSGVDPNDYPKFTVTLQREGRPPVPSNLVVLTGTLSG